MKKLLTLVSVALLLSSCGLGSDENTPETQEVVFDDFNDGVLDPLWSVELENATDWTYAESGTELTVTNITPVVGIDTPASVILTQYVVPHDNFNVTFELSWDSEDSEQAVQGVSLELHDDDGETITWAGYQDLWQGSSGSQWAYINGNTYQSGQGSLELSGNATITISRQDSNISIYWDGDLINSGTDSRQVERVLISFGQLVLDADGGESLFGSLSVDAIEME